MLPKLDCKKNTKGFSFLELLIIIIIIGTLAAIATPQLKHYKQRMYDRSAKANLQNLYLACKAYWADNSGGDQCSVSIAQGTSYGFNPSTNMVLSVIDGSEAGFRAKAKHNISAATFTMDSDGNIS